MAKRFVDTEKFKKPFYRGLTGAYKILWDYICNDCNHAGIWIVDLEIAQMYIGKDMPIDKDTALRLFNDGEQRILEISNGQKWFIMPFVKFQYGELRETNNAHKSVISELKKYIEIEKMLLLNQGAGQPLTSPSQGAMDMDMDKEMDKDIEGVQGEILELGNSKSDSKQNPNSEPPPGKPIDPHPALGPYQPKQKHSRSDCAKTLVMSPEEQAWREIVMMNNGIRTRQDLENKMLRFLKSNGEYGHTEQTTLKDFKMHFANWLKNPIANPK
jgi:hypothetical protein